LSRGILKIDFDNQGDTSRARPKIRSWRRVRCRSTWWPEWWSGNQRDDIQYLCILVGKLRPKIEAVPNRPRLLVTESAVGYRLQVRMEDRAADW